MKNLRFIILKSSDIGGPGKLCDAGGCHNFDDRPSVHSMVARFSSKPRVVWLYPKIEKPMGGTNFVLYAAAALQKYFEVVIVAQKASQSYLQTCAELGLPLIDFARPSFTDPAFWLLYPFEIATLTRRLKDVLKDGDVVVSSMFPMHIAAHRLGRNDIQVVYEPFAPYYDQSYIRQLGPAVSVFLRTMKAIYGREEIVATRGAGNLLTLSEFERKRLETIYGRRAEVIFEGVDTDIFNQAATPIPDYSGQVVVLHSTGFDRFKGTDTVIASVPELVRRIPSVKVLVTYTREDRHALERYNSFLAAEGVADHVKFHGSVPYFMLPRLYRTAAVYVEPGSDRSMSLSVKEAMACGTPVVRGLAGIEEVTDGIEGFLVAAGDLTTFVDRVARICNDSELRKRMSAAGVERVFSQFTWQRVADRIAQHIRAAAAHGSTSA